MWIRQISNYIISSELWPSKNSKKKKKEERRKKKEERRERDKWRRHRIDGERKESAREEREREREESMQRMKTGRKVGNARPCARVVRGVTVRPAGVRSQATQVPRRGGSTSSNVARVSQGFALRAASSDLEENVSTTSIIEDLKNAAMHLHTKDQAASGGQEAKKRPEFKPTREGYLRYLEDSRIIFSTLEDIVKDNAKLSKLRENGLERAGALDTDIALLSGMGVEPAGYEGDASPGAEYAKYLKDLSEENLPGFICHYYNTYFAHTAGGRMIGKAVSDRILDGRKLDFYHNYPQPVKKLSKPVKDSLEDIALEWSDEEKSKCVDETGKAFKYAGLVMRQMVISE